MQIEIQARRVPLSRKVRNYFKSQVQIAMGRYDERITKVSLWLSDINGPKGGSDKNCRMKITMAGKPDVVIVETRENLHLAINLAIARAGKAVMRKIDRQRSRIKRSAQMLPMLSEAA